MMKLLVLFVFLFIGAAASGAEDGSRAGEPIPVHRMYWFAWYSFHPDTSLIM